MRDASLCVGLWLLFPLGLQGGHPEQLFNVLWLLFPIGVQGGQGGAAEGEGAAAAEDGGDGRTGHRPRGEGARAGPVVVVVVMIMITIMMMTMMLLMMVVVVMMLLEAVAVLVVSWRKWYCGAAAESTWLVRLQSAGMEPIPEAEEEDDPFGSDDDEEEEVRPLKPCGPPNRYFIWRPRMM
jgi:hypothetical protein